jgi:iron complex outermembrane recepter protein
MARPTTLDRTVRALIAGSVLATTGLATNVALAQAEVALDEVIVTGSRIASPNANSSSPILAVTAESLRQSGINDTGDLVDFLPQIVSVAGVDLSNTSNPLSGPGGVTTVNLRGLGPQRTLVLVDGRRLGVGDPDTGNPNSSPDINQIPSALIERIDVVTGGASAAYGSDAIAGVVNFVLKRDFEGVQVDAQYGFLQHNQQSDFMQNLLTTANLPQPSGSVTDGKNYSASVLVGGNFGDGKGNATAYLSYFSSDPVTLSERDFSACQLAGDGTVCGGSSNSNYFRRSGTAPAFSVLGTSLIARGSQVTTPPALFNSNPYMNLFQGTDRYQAGVLSHYEFNEHADVYGDFMFTNNRHNTAVAPSGAFRSIFQVNCNNPLLSAQQQTTLGCTPAQIAAGQQIGVEIGRRNIEGGPRMFGYEHTNYRGVLGVRGDINDTWSYDTYGSYYYTTLFNTNENYVSLERGSLALNGCLTGPGQVAAVTDSSCTPWNIWRDGGVTPEASEYIAAYGISNGSTSQTIFSASTTGDLGNYGIKLPTARDGVAVAFGVEWRDDTFKYLPDLALGSGDLLGGSGASPTIDESASVSEFFTEIRVPLIQDMAFAQMLEFEAGYRYSDYELSGGVDTYKFGLQWMPVEDVRFRASFNHAIRAPSLIELYVSQTVTQTSDISSDPCAPLNGVTAAATLAQCQLTGVTAAQYGNGLSTNIIPQCVSSQCSTLTGGNPDLKPEEADTISIGVTLTPRFLPNFSLSVDWYRIDMEGLVGVVPLSVSMQGCLTGAQPLYCQNVVRDSEGSITGDFVETGGYVAGTNFNVAEGTFSGIDIQGTYDINLGGLGSLQAALNAVYMQENSSIPLAGEPRYDCAGLYGNTCGSALPDWRHTLRLTWQFPIPVQASLQWRYISSVTNEQNTDDPTLSPPGTDPVTFGGTLSSRSYLDLSGSWNINETFTVRAGINNILDQDPPLVDTGWSGPGTPNTWGPYDTLGRQIFMSATAKF